MDHKMAMDFMIKYNEFIKITGLELVYNLYMKIIAPKLGCLTLLAILELTA